MVSPGARLFLVDVLLSNLLGANGLFLLAPPSNWSEAHRGAVLSKDAHNMELQVPEVGSCLLGIHDSLIYPFRATIESLSNRINQSIQDPDKPKKVDEDHHAATIDNGDYKLKYTVHTKYCTPSDST
jgi:hypothetical protein